MNWNITLVIVDELEHADVPFPEVLVHPFDETAEVMFQFIVGRAVQFRCFLQSDIGGMQLHTCFLYGVFLFLAILLYVEFIDYYQSYKETCLQLHELKKEVFLAMENLNTIVGQTVFNY